MEKVKRIFGELNITWPKLIIFAIIAGIYVATMALIPALKETSFHDIAVSFEVWILIGIIIIMNSKSPLDSALKCFIFFLISQPLIYLIQDVINHSHLFYTYYRNWVLWTIATLPMGFFGYYLKKDKWWGLIILCPILIFLGLHFGQYLSETIFSFPLHLLTALFCFITLLIYPLVIFNNKKIKIAGVIISIVIIAIMIIYTIIKPPIYNTDLLTNGGSAGAVFDNTYKVYLVDEGYGKVNIEYESGLDDWIVKAKLKKAGKTELILESPNGEKEKFELIIKRNTYTITKKN